MGSSLNGCAEVPVLIGRYYHIVARGFKMVERHLGAAGVTSSSLRISSSSPTSSAQGSRAGETRMTPTLAAELLRDHGILACRLRKTADLRSSQWAFACGVQIHETPERNRDSERPRGRALRHQQQALSGRCRRPRASSPTPAAFGGYAPWRTFISCTSTTCSARTKRRPGLFRARAFASIKLIVGSGPPRPVARGVARY